MAPTPSGAPLRRHSVLIVGVGGLGAPAALALAAAGIGTLGLADGDRVELSNLNRQILFRTGDLGASKAVIAAARLQRSHPELTVRIFDHRLTLHDAAPLFRTFDFVIDATDGVESKYLVNDAAVRCGVAFSHAGVLGFQGQTLTVVPGRSACLRCLFPVPPSADDLPSCQEAGILGSVAGTIGTLQAAEAVKYLLGLGRLLTDRVLTYDARAATWRAVPVQRRPACPICGDQPAEAGAAPAAAATCKSSRLGFR
jgi:molybdopterin-synthase adenylyltransferase